MILGIDASNIRGGGGVTHLVELLKAAKPNEYGFEKVFVWGGKLTVDKIQEKSWLEKVEEPFLNKGLPFRVYWQKLLLSKRAVAAKCDILFIPGSSYSGSFKPFVTLSQNLLPFEAKEMKRYGLSWQLVRLLLLRIVQSKTFLSADGVIFLTEYAKSCISKVIGKTKGQVRIIPHGINLRFDNPVKLQRKISSYTKENPFRILYISMIDMYKHQGNVSEAISDLLTKGFHLRLDLVGPSYSPALKKLNAKLDELKLKFKDLPIYYQDSVPHEELGKWYSEADIFVFASSCENMPIILMESMVAGLPIASSNFGPMPEVLQKDGVYFNPENPNSISDAILKLLESTELRTNIAASAYKRSKSYNWQSCANETFQFLKDTALLYKKKNV